MKLLPVLIGVLVSSLRLLCGADNILLISVDTLRADRLGCYGYRQNKTPAMDRWAAEGVRFERAYTEYPLTLPAHATLLTGTYPLRHGIRENVGFSLDAGRVTLAEILKASGYATAGFIGSYVLASQFGMAQGFETFDDDFGTPFEKAAAATALRRAAGQVADRFLAWLDNHRGKRFFAFVHFYDPHAPCPAGYDAEVTRVDGAVSRIDAYLRKWDLLGKTHIMLVSDHGESLGEHGESGHGFFLYDSTLHIPLIIRPASNTAYSRRQIKTSVSLVDVMPTILQLAGVKTSAVLQGRSLVPMILREQADDPGTYAETYIPQLQCGWSPLRSYRLGRYKLIDAPRAEFYDLASDPGERTNILEANRPLAAKYRTKLEEFVARLRPPAGQRAASNPVLEASEKLAALGYVRLGSKKVRNDFGKGIDPKDRIVVFEKYHELVNGIAGGRASIEVLDRIGEIRKKAPEFKELVFLEAQALESLGRLQEAHARFQQGLSVEPENTVARAAMANLLLRLGRIDEAEREFRQVLASDPGDYRSRNNLAGIYGMKGNAEAALAELKRALAARPSYAAGWHNLGQLYIRMKNLAGAEAALRKAVSFDRSDARAYFLLAQVLKAEGKTAEAGRQMRIALELDPNLASSRK